MSKVKTVLWKDLKFKYSPNDNYHGTCYYGALRLLLKKDFDKLFNEVFSKELIKNSSTKMNTINPFSKWAYENKDYRFASEDESLHDEEGVLWINGDDGKSSHIVYFKDGYYYDDYMSLSCIKDLVPVLIIVKEK